MLPGGIFTPVLFEAFSTTNDDRGEPDGLLVDVGGPDMVGPV